MLMEIKTERVVDGISYSVEEAARTCRGAWRAWTETPPLMEVEGDSEAIVRGIVERTLLWYAEREVNRRHAEMTRALAEIVEFKAEEAEYEDTAPSELSGC